MKGRGGTDEKIRTDKHTNTHTDVRTSTTIPAHTVIQVDISSNGCRQELILKTHAHTSFTLGAIE